jgi:glutathione S-transferase
MKLFYVPGSPYARMVRVALLETGLAARVPQEEVTLRDPGSALLPFNPVGRVPTLLLDDGTVLTEALLILSYLDRQHGGARLMPEAPARLAELGVAMGLLEGIAVWNRELRRPVSERSPTVLALEETRANRTSDRLEAMVAPGGDGGAYGGALDAGRIALGCGLGYCEGRHRAWSWRAGRPRLAAWFDALTSRPSFQATTPPVN